MPATRDPRNEFDAHAALHARADSARLTPRHETARAAASIARHRRFRAFLALLLWFALLAILGALAAVFLSR